MIWAVSRARRRGARDVVIGFVVMLLLIGGWRWCARWRTGRVELVAVGEPVTVQILDETSERPIGERVGVVGRAVIELPDGEFKLQVEGQGRLSRTFRFSVNRGETLGHSISIDEGRLLGGEPGAESNEKRRALPVRIPAGTAAGALELSPGKADMVAWTEQSLNRRDGATGKVIWEVVGPEDLRTLDSMRDRLRWRVLEMNVPRTRVVKPAPDLDGDGTGDLILNVRSLAAFAAFSGKNGAMRWMYFADESGRLGSPPSKSEREFRSLNLNAVAGQPALADVNRDRAPDLIATFVVSTMINQERRIVAAISGRSGECLWTYPIDETPKSATSADFERPAVLVEGRESKLVAVVDGSEWTGLDPATGTRRIGPVELGLKPVVPVQHADLNGDGEPEILAFGQEPGGKERVLRAFDIKSGKEVWALSFDAASDQLLKDDSSRGLPALVNVDGDGRPEILARDAGPPSRRRAGYRGIRLLEGATGAIRWRVAMSPAKEGVQDRVEAVIEAPDLDQDGCREIVTVSSSEVRGVKTIHVDALSGKDGARIWTWSMPTDGRETAIEKPVWWGRGPDGWPLLALPLGGEAADGKAQLPGEAPQAPPIVHLLETSTGRERHRVLGLANAGFADLDGDGLADLWGEVEGELRAFRGEAAEAWRALGHFDGAGRPRDDSAFWQKLGAPAALHLGEALVEPTRTGMVDFDGDGVADVLTRDVQAPGNALYERNGGHTAVARSGRDGRVIWKAQIDPRGRWFNPTSGESYELHAVPLPAGDLDGDGTPDVIVNKGIGPGRFRGTGGATIDVELLSGRTGLRIWTGGRLPASSLRKAAVGVEWADACVVEPQGRPDVILGRGALFGRSALTRVSGRDGRVLWDLDLPARGRGAVKFPHFFADLDGDGGMDVLVVIPGAIQSTKFEHHAVAVSLRDGKRLWEDTLGTAMSQLGIVCVGDVDGDGRQEVVVLDDPSETMSSAARVRVLGVRDGKARWSWTLDNAKFLVDQPHDLTLAHFDGDATRSVCVSVTSFDEAREVIILDPTGKQRTRRALGRKTMRSVNDLVGGFSRPGFPLGPARKATARLTAIDLDGDGRDELVIYHADKIQVWNRDLKDVWFWPSRFGKLEQVIPSAPGRPGTVIVPPGVFLDGATGQPRWTGQAPVFDSSAEITPEKMMPRILDAGGPERQPLLIAGGMGATVCREAIATDRDGSVAAPRGKVVRRRLYGDDPRWARPLPWVAKMVGALGPNGFLVGGCLAFVNVFVPLVILRLATRRRRAFNMWALLMLPVVAAVPLVVYQTVLPWLIVGDGRLLSTENRVFLTGTFAGIPVFYFLLVVGVSLVRRQWKTSLAFMGVFLLATLLVAGVWIWIDRRSMAVGMEHYVWEGWEQVLLVGAYSTALFWGAGKTGLAIYKLLRRRSPNAVNIT